MGSKDMGSIERLTALQVSRAKAPGMYADGRGLYLAVTTAGARSWVYRFMLRGCSREMGLGSLTAVTLAEARRKATEARRLRAAGADPLEAKRAERAAAAVATAKTVTFREAAAAYVEAHRAGWRNAKHAGQWETTLSQYAYPVIGALPVCAIDTGLVVKVLEPLWTTKTETASRLRGRIESVLDWAKVRGYRDGENPARWKGHLANALPPPRKIKKIARLSALPYGEVPALMSAIRARDGVAMRALEFLILTAARSGEVLGAPWGEIDLVKGTWTIPAERMKAGREHRVPLSTRAAAILRDIPDRIGPVFSRHGVPLGHGAIATALGRSDVTVHGFRSTFRDWAAEQTNVPREIAELSLAHKISTAAEAAYQRSDLLDKRRRLMDAWGAFCSAPESAGREKVIALR
jgi:integrase